MKRRKMAMLLAISLLMCGCGPVCSLFPLYYKKDIVAHDQILGRWLSTELSKKKDNKAELGSDRSYWEFKKGEEGAYHVSIFDEKTGKLQILSDVHFLQLGGNLFMDVEAQKQDDDQPATLFPVIGAHIFGRVFSEQENIRIELLDADWCQAAILQKGIHLDFAYPDSTLVLTTNTNDLQKFAVEYGNDTDAFSNGYILEHAKQPTK